MQYLGVWLLMWFLGYGLLRNYWEIVLCDGVTCIVHL